MREKLTLSRAFEFTESYRRIISKVDPLPNSPINIDNREIKVLADWGKRACDLINWQAEEIDKQQALIEQLVEACKAAKTDASGKFDRGLITAATFTLLDVVLAAAEKVKESKNERTPNI